MKKLLALLLAACMIFAMAACGNTEPTEAPTEAPTEGPAVDTPTEAPTEPEPTEPEPVTLRFWQAGGDTVGASTVMRLLLDKFEAQYPWITVEYQAIPWSNDPHTQFTTGIAGDDIADVLVVGSPLDFQLAGEGNILALDDLMSEELKADISEVLLSECTYVGSNNPDFYGKVMSLPLYGGSRAILYNKDIFDFFGQPYPTEQMSHAELLELAKKLTGDMNGKKVYGYGTRATDSAQYINFVWNYGAKLIDSNTMTPATDSAEWAKGIEDYLKFYTEGVTPEGSVAMDATTQLNMFINGEIAMFMSAVDYAVTIRDEWNKEGGIGGDKLGVAALVGETYATSYTGADVLVVPAATEHEEEAALLLNFLMSAEAQATYCKNVGFFPGVKSAAADPFFSEDPIQAGFAAAMEGCHYFGSFGVGGIGNILRPQIQMLINGEIDMATYQANITAEIQASIDAMN